MVKDNYQLLIEKLDGFIRKYYINRLIKGTLYSTGVILALFVLFSILEYNFYFSTGTRKALFFSFVGISIIALVGWIIMPLMQYFKLGQVISHEQAASIVGEHFSNIKDKLLNILQLKKQANNSVNTDLVYASINQKTKELNPIPFQKAIDLGKNRQYLRFALPPLLLLFALLLIDANIVKDSTTRLINYNTETEIPAPFKFSVANKDLTVVQFNDFDLDVEVDGEVLPNDVFIDIDGYQYKLEKIEKNKFKYTFSKVAKDVNFKLTASGFDSKGYELNTLKKPNIVGFDTNLKYPSYTGRKNETLKNIGDIVVPQGTNIQWFFTSQNTDDISIKFSNRKKATEAKRTGNENFVVKKQQMKNESYMVYVSNENLPNADSVAYSISVIPDGDPTITVEQFDDSTQKDLLFFVGDASDDYGLSQLTFNYSIEGEGKSGAMQKTPMKLEGKKQTQYDFTWDIETLQLKPGDKLTYYFEVYDNDAINGRKSARTTVMTYAIPSIEEYEEMASANNENIKDKLEDAMKESKELQESMKKIREDVLQKKELDWQDRKEIEKLLERHKKLEEDIQEAQENFKENLENQNQMEEPNEELMEKQEQLQKLFDELMSDEMKEMMKKMQELMEEMDKKATMEELEDFEMNDEKLEKELDRMLELFKQLEFEQELQQTVDKLEKLAKEQEELSEETKKEEKGKEQLEQEQKELNEKFDKIKEKMDKLEEKNQELQKPNDLNEQKEQEKGIEEDMKKAQQDLQKQQNQKASESQKSASQKMKDMANSMQMMMQSAQMEQMQEDIEALRQLLENLVTLSFEQEALLKDVQRTRINTPKYTEEVQAQYKIQDDFTIVDDSLQALSKRVFQIESFITEKVTDIKKNLKRGLGDLEERRKRDAGVKQQRVMKGLNDLALMLSEVMEQMQQQMAGQMSGSQMCQKPKGGQPMMKLGEMQKQMNQQMQQMMEQMGKGKGKGKGKKGKRGKMSKEYAEMAAKQAAIRRALKELEQKRQEQGKGKGAGMQELIDKMEQTEIDLVNKRLNNETYKRQKDILVKLLEHAKAEREQEQENKREAKSARKKERKMPPALEEYIKKKESEIELYKTVSPSLKPYYKSLVEEYYKSLKKN